MVKKISRYPDFYFGPSQIFEILGSSAFREVTLLYIVRSDAQGRNWRFVKGGRWRPLRRGPQHIFEIGPLNDAFSGHPIAK